MRSGWEILIQDPSPEGLLNALANEEVRFYGTQRIDGVTLYFCVPYGKAALVRQIAERRGSELRMCRPFGGRKLLLRLSGRRVLLATVLLCGVLLAVSNLFVWRIEVRGNETVPTGAIMRAVTQAGGGIGRFWPGFDGEQMRTEILLMLEDIQWVGINYRSGAIEVVVRERKEVPEIVDNEEPVHVVAEKAGIVTSLTAKQGQPRAAAGDTVERGQVLISGAAVSSIGSTRTVHALGSAEARTWYAISARQPAAELEKVYSGRNKRKFALIIGRKRINFYWNSSIFESECDTIIMDYRLCMDDVFSLPVRVLVQECTERAIQERALNQQTQKSSAQRALMEELERRIGEDGSVTATEFAETKRADGITVTVMAECLEEIGTEVPISESELRQIQQDNSLREEATND